MSVRTIETSVQAMANKAKRSSVTTELVTVIPSVAQAWLDQNVHNRKVSDHLVRRYMRDMKDGTWRVTGDGIRFSKSGKLLDGQHRLIACVRAQTNFETFVVYGLDDLDQEFIDIGKARNIVDIFDLRGIQNSRRLSSSLRLLLAYKDGVANVRSQAYSPAVITAALERHPNITKSVALTNNIPKGAPIAAIGFLHYVGKFMIKKPDVSDAMHETWLRGIPHYEGDPMHYLRERLIRKSDAAEMVKPEVLQYTIFHAWNMLCDSAKVTHIRWQKEPIDIKGLKRETL